jgi:hypothetical protein
MDYSGTRTRKPRGRPRGALGPAAKAIREAVLDDLTKRYARMTVRQAFYALVVAAIVAKTEGGYRQVQKQLAAMRRAGDLDWGFIADGTRWMRKPDSYDSAEDYIEAVSRSYRRDLWQSQGVRIEIWLEKDALADIIMEVTDKWDVPLMVSRGQSSLTFLHAAAQEATMAYGYANVSTYIYALYDYDAGGDRASRAVESDLPEFAPGVPITFERLAVTPAQISNWTLPTRPPKKKDPEAKKWGNKPCVELDAIDPIRLTNLVEGVITSHVNQREWEIEKLIEEEERKGLLALRDSFNGGAP